MNTETSCRLILHPGQQGRTIYYDTERAIGSNYTTYATPAEDEVLVEIDSTGKVKCKVW